MCLLTFSPKRLVVVLIYLSTIATSRRLLNPTGDDDCSWDVNAYDDGPTADREAGIGVEFESKGCSQEHTDQAKGKLVDDREGKDRKLTADTTLEAKGRLDAEYILDGTKIKLDNGRAGAAAAELAADLAKWDPGADRPADEKKVNIEDNKCNPWTIIKPARHGGSGNIGWARQITAPLPLEAVNDLISKTKTSPVLNHPLLPLLRSRTSKMVWVKSEFFQSKPNGIASSTIKSDGLGFFSLVLSYAKSADQVRKGSSPKLLTSIMPRTDFGTMLKLILPQVKSGLTGGPTSLYDLVKILACYKNEEDEVILDTKFCTGDVEKPQPTNELDKMEFRISFGSKSKTLSIKDWMGGVQAGNDPLAKADKIIDGQIGGLGKATEKILNGDRALPLLEFRDLGSSKSSAFKSDVEKAEKALVDYHKKFAAAPKARLLRRTGDLDSKTGRAHLKSRRGIVRPCVRPDGPSEPTTNSPPPSPPPPSTPPTDPPSQPSCVPNPKDKVKDSHEHDVRLAVDFFCADYAKDTNAKSPVKVEQTVMAGTRFFGVRGRGAVEMAYLYKPKMGDQDDVYDLSITSVPDCKPLHGNNLSSPLAGTQCKDLLFDSWKKCNNKGRGGKITAGCLVYSIRTKY